MYARYLESLILRESGMYYNAEAIRLRGTCDPLEYERRVNNFVYVIGLDLLTSLHSLHQVDARLSNEEIRARECLSTQTSVPLQDIIQNAFRPSYPSFMQLFASM